MKNRKLIMNIAVAVSLVLMVVGICLNLWNSVVEFAGTKHMQGVGIFTDKTGMDSGWLGTICEVALVVVMALTVAYLVLWVLELLKVGKPAVLAKIKNILAYVTLGLVLVAIVTGILFPILATSELGMPGASIAPAVGFYLFAVGTVVAGVCELVAGRK